MPAHFHHPSTPTADEILLTDNGSLRPASTLALRGLAAHVQTITGQAVRPVSVLHSDKVPPAQLNGQPAETVINTLRDRLKAGQRTFTLLPLFFGPSRAVTQYLPARLGPLRQQYPDLEIRVAPFLASGDSARDTVLVDILEQHTRELRALEHPDGAHVVLVDHGTPEPAVNKIRNHLAACLRERVGDAGHRVFAASMERRPGQRYAFNKPLLEHLLPDLTDRPVAVTMLFLHPGRHAGPAGDIAQIIARCVAHQPALRVGVTRLVGEHPRLAELLAQRLVESDGSTGLA